ncbi:coproporphyrinogen-III oxidase family protein [Bryobacter aggregatus]|uniref:coproporphyrinogen-III oxidase family protein n=1 Tax=Bryobacter aggregatus TaxID=360054 RepID=UPI0004E12CD7|nr:coproporphyrinogen-III oxidase family protein [Bryobacter aggregatus]
MAGVYISYPFCAQKCTYCNFASGVFPKQLEPLYQRRLLEEIEKTNWSWTPETIYFGGGTPSLWDTGEVEAVLAAIPGAPWREVTMEAAPGSLTEERVAAWARLGINRVSLGVQSLIETELRRTGRKHTAAIVESDGALLRRHGITEINLDLIAGLAGQTRESWQQSVEGVIALAVPHVSVYILEVDEESRLGQEVLFNGQRYGARDVPSDDLQAEFYEYAVERLAAVGIARYEISNFARPGHESLHNLKYWKLEPYLGFGADAHSFDGQWRWQNAEDVEAYTNGAAAPEREAADTAGERYWVGLRLAEGVPEGDAAKAKIERLIEDGLLERLQDRIRLTPRGVLLSNEVFQEFLSDGSH